MDMECPAGGIQYNVQLVPQPDKLSCWAASMAMLVGYRRNQSLPAEDIANEVGQSLRTSYDWTMLDAARVHFGFQDITLPSNASLYLSPDQWCQWLAQYGPLWITVVGAPSHAVVVAGIQGDMTSAGTTAIINNPWDVTQTFSSDPIDFDPPNYGIALTPSFTDLAADFGLMDLDDYGSWRVLYLP